MGLDVVKQMTDSLIHGIFSGLVIGSMFGEQDN
jgi:hypothetical protein